MQSGSYRSARLVQAMSIVDRLDFQQVAYSDDKSSILSFIKMTSRGMAVEMQANQYQRANEAFYRAFEVINGAFSMNSSNLEFLVELMSSQIMWNMGEYNHTVASFFQVSLVRTRTTGGPDTGFHRGSTSYRATGTSS